MQRPDRVVVGDALGVVPHAITVDDAGAGRLGDAQHPAVDMRGHPAEQLFGYPTHPRRPVLAHQVVVTADAAAGHHDGLGAELEVADDLPGRRDAAGGCAGLQHRATHPDDGTVLDDELVDAVPVGEPHPVAGEPPREDVDQSGAGPPGDVEARHGVSVPAGVVAAAFSPAHHREGLQAAVAQPGAFLPGGEVDVGMCPLPGPVVFGTVEAGGAEPVLQSQFVAVADAEPTLFGAVDEEQPAERPVGLAAQIDRIFLVDDQDATAALEKFACRDQTGQPGAHHDDISLISHYANLASAAPQAASVSAGR